MHIADFIDRFGVNKHHVRTRCGQLVMEQNIISLSDYRGAKATLVLMGDENPDENVCRDCLAAVVDDRLVPGRDG